MKTLVVFLTVFLIVLTACSDSNSPSDNYGKIKVLVMNVKDNTPLSNALITTDPASESISTDSNGEILLSNLIPGNYKVIAAKMGFITNSTTVKVLENKTVQATIYLYDDSYNNNLPDKPILLTPSNNSTVKKLTSYLTWSCTDKDNDELSYTVFFDNVNPPVKIAASDISLTSLKIDDLIQGNTYYWYVAAKDKFGIGPKSSVNSFIVDTNITIIPEDNLVLHMTFDNNFNDASKNKLQTSCTNATYSTGRKGETNGSFAFLNRNTITVKDNYVIDFTNNFSVSFWINPNSGYGFDMIDNLTQIIGRAGGTGANTSSWYVELSNQGTIIFGTYNTISSSSRQLANAKIEAGKWTHFCVIYSNSTVTFYINGELDLVASISQPQISSYDLHIGGRVLTNNRYFNGYMDDLKIFNKVLTVDEVKGLFNE